ncbi:MAG: SGNH/GDSL hydrolase family protein [Pseudomonadota bacterium]
MRFILLFIYLLLPTGISAQSGPKVQIIGDSLMATHVLTGRAIPNVLAKELGVSVDNNAALGATIRRIVTQYEPPKTPGALDWVVINGGGNDLWLGCGCSKCAARLAQIISPDGARGALPDLIAKIRADGARVLYVGYLRSPGFGSPIEHCRDDGDELERRAAQMAAQMNGVWLISNAEIVPFGDRSFHAFDRIHPSVKGSRVIGKRIASAIRQLDMR